MDFNVVEHVHVVDEGLVRRRIDIEVASNGHFAKPFAVHEIEVVGGLKAQPVEFRCLIVGFKVEPL